MDQQQRLHLIRQDLITRLSTSQDSLQIGQSELLHFAELLSSTAFLQRFSLKNKLDHDNTISSILSHIDWRLNASISTRFISTLPKVIRESYLDVGLFHFHGTDVTGRPLAILNLDRYIPRYFLLLTPRGGDIDDLRYFLICFLECARRYIDHMNEMSADIISISVLMDLEKVGLKNLAYDLLPTFYDLFHMHYPR
jgi:hypothetical protein